MNSGLDAADRRLLNLLRQDARRTNSDLAQAAGLTPSTCLRRVRALEQSGVIQGYTALVAEPQDDRIVVITRITLERQSEELMQKFEAAVRLHPEIEECFLMTGDADYVLRTSAASAAGYEQIHKEILSRLPGVSRINSSIALRDVLRASRTKRSSPARRG